MKKLFSTALYIFLAAPLCGKNITNQNLLTACKDKSSASQNFCYGFVISAANAAQFYRNIVDAQGEYLDICFPEDIQNKTLVDLYIAWAEKNKSLLNTPAFIGVSTSFSTKYSCNPEKES